MQKIIIKNFGPIKDAEIVITPLLVLIGEQATGKSTIAKLIYFFKTLSKDLFSRYLNRQNVEIGLSYDLTFIIEEKFFNFFGSTSRMDEFKITYHYNEEKYITLSLTAKKNFLVSTNKNFFEKKQLKELQKYKQALFEFENIKTVDHLAKDLLFERFVKRQFMSEYTRIINDMFCNTHNDFSYIIAGRNATIGYSNFFESMLAANLQKRLESVESEDFETKTQTIDETLMLEFLQHVSDMRQFLNKSGDFEGVIKDAPKEKKDILIRANSLIQKVIRGNYSSGIDEKIIVDEGKKSVFLRNASSGQQEAIRILQDAFIAIHSNKNVFRIIEEPEAHIFPTAQMYLLELLAMLLNNKEENQMIITTHSPYVLTVINNLMYAYKVGQEKTEKASEIVNKLSWLAPEKVNAYMLTSEKGAERIIDDELYMIKAERIDEVSRTLNEDYDKLLDIEYEK